MEDSKAKKDTAEKVAAPDVLDELKAQEAMYRKLVLIKMVADIKVMAKEILKMKEKTGALLLETGLSAEDAKRVIDFLNSQPNVQLTADDKDDIKAWAKKEVETARKKLEDKAEKSDSPFIQFAPFFNKPMGLGNGVGTYGLNGSGHITEQRFRSGYSTGDPITDMGTLTFCSATGDGKLEVKI